jgi:hypothetical protein
VTEQSQIKAAQWSFLLMILCDRSDPANFMCLLSVVAGHKEILFRLAALSIIEAFISQNNPALLNAIWLCDIYDFFVRLGQFHRSSLNGNEFDVCF